MPNSPSRAFLTLSGLNMLVPDEFALALCSVFEYSPWVAERALGLRPFGSVEAIHAAMMQCVADASAEEQLRLIRAHPELAGQEALRGELTTDSTTEQGRLGFTALTRGELDLVADINRRYRARFGFPCIVALALHSDRAGVIAQMERRIGNEPQVELRNALREIGHITRVRLARIIAEE